MPAPAPVVAVSAMAGTAKSKNITRKSLILALRSAAPQNAAYCGLLKRLSSIA
jgi:hypothetical protein